MNFIAFRFSGSGLDPVASPFLVDTISQVPTKAVAGTLPAPGASAPGMVVSARLMIVAATNLFIIFVALSANQGLPVRKPLLLDYLASARRVSLKFEP